MGGFSKIIQAIIAIGLLLLLLWLAFWLFLFIIGAGILVTGYMYLRRFLIQKGIVNAPFNPSAPAADDIQASVDEEIIVIETDYRDITPNERAKRD